MRDLRPRQPRADHLSPEAIALIHEPLPQGTAAAEEISRFLRRIQELADKTERKAKIVPTPVAWKDAATRDKELRRLTNVADDWGEEECKEYRLWGTVPGATQGIKRSRLYYWIVTTAPSIIWHKTQQFRRMVAEEATEAELEAAEDAHRGGMTDWHAVAMKVEGTKAWIYDPSYTEPDGAQGGKRQLKTARMVNRAQDMVKRLIPSSQGKRRADSQVYIGGGGNTSGDCVAMACEWVRTEILYAAGVGPDERSRIVDHDERAEKTWLAGDVEWEKVVL